MLLPRQEAPIFSRSVTAVFVASSFLLFVAPIAQSQTDPSPAKKLEELRAEFCRRKPSHAWCQPAPSPTPSPTPTPTPTPSTSPTPSPTPTPSPSPTPTGSPGERTFAAATGTEAASQGSFRVECQFTHRAQVDPIVAPGKPSGHLHDFVGNPSTNQDSTYESMLQGGTNCTNAGDTAGYWAPTLVSPTGEMVAPERGIFYYRNRPVGYRSTTTFPGDFRVVAGGDGTFPASYWTCDGESDGSYSTSKSFVPNCNGKKLKMHIYFPSCADGRYDSPDHRSHLVYGLKDGQVETRFPETCPESHPIKVPQLDFRYRYPITDGTNYRFSSGESLPHADFWNTWDQSTLESLVGRCLRTPQSCGAPAGG